MGLASRDFAGPGRYALHNLGTIRSAMFDDSHEERAEPQNNMPVRLSSFDEFVEECSLMTRRARFSRRARCTWRWTFSPTRPSMT